MQLSEDIKIIPDVITGITSKKNKNIDGFDKWYKIVYFSEKEISL